MVKFRLVFLMALAIACSGQDVANVACMGVDDTAAVNAALAETAMQVNLSGLCTFTTKVMIPKGKKLVFGVGRHSVAGLQFTDSKSDRSGSGAIECAGSELSTLQLRPGANTDVIGQENFSSLTLSNSSFGLFRASVKGCTIDGNRTAQDATSYGIRLYGHSLRLDDIQVINSFNDGIYTEWGLDSTFASPLDDLEATFTNIKSMFNNGNGWTFRGPHDSQVTNAVLYQNGGWGFRAEQSSTYNASGTMLANVNTFLNPSGGIYSNASLAGSNVSATTGTGWGMLIDRDSGGHQFSSSIFTGPIGLEVRSANHTISGLVANTTNAGILFNGGGGSFSLVFTNNSGANADFTTGGGGVSGGLSLLMSSAAGVKDIYPRAVLFRGTPPSNTTILVSFGAADQFVNLPTLTLNSRGWSPRLPQSNGTLAVVGDPAQSGTISATQYRASGLTGLTTVKTIKGSNGENCTLTITGGIITATTCP